VVVDAEPDPDGPDGKERFSFRGETKPSEVAVAVSAASGPVEATQ
jgi:hypothetical protein